MNDIKLKFENVTLESVDESDAFYKWAEHLYEPVRGYPHTIDNPGLSLMNACCKGKRAEVAKTIVHENGSRDMDIRCECGRGYRLKGVRFDFEKMQREYIKSLQETDGIDVEAIKL